MNLIKLLFTTSYGWLALFVLVIGIVLHIFIIIWVRRKMKESEMLDINQKKE